MNKSLEAAHRKTDIAGKDSLSTHRSKKIRDSSQGIALQPSAASPKEGARTLRPKQGTRRAEYVPSINELNNLRKKEGRRKKGDTSDFQRQKWGEVRPARKHIRTAKFTRCLIHYWN